MESDSFETNEQDVQSDLKKAKDVNMDSDIDLDLDSKDIMDCVEKNDLYGDADSKETK